MKDKSPAEAAKLFSVPDFIGDACKAIASRVRGTVAQVQFDEFHKVSTLPSSSSSSSLPGTKLSLTFPKAILLYRYFYLLHLFGTVSFLFTCP